MDPYEGVEIEYIPEETEEDRKRQRIIKRVAGIVLAFLVLGFLIPVDIVGSIIEGREVQKLVIQGNGFSVTFDAHVYNGIRNHYVGNHLAETRMCFTGKRNGNDFSVTGFYIPTIYYQTPISVRSEFCNSNTIITVHTHPFRNCLLSAQDVRSFEAYKKVNPDAISAVMCDHDTFAFIGI